MNTISLCMIVKNERDTLDRCLASVTDAVDEIVVVDTGSTDGTKETAIRWKARVYDFPWVNDFAAARNFAFGHATMDYVMWLDADDVLLPDQSLKLRELKNTLSPDVDAVSMAYHVDFDRNGNVALAVRRTRLVKRSRNYRWEGAVHEDLSINGAESYVSDIVVTHRKEVGKSDPDRNLRIYERMQAEGRAFAPRDTLHFAMELHQHRQYGRAAEQYLLFAESESLLPEVRIHAYQKLADCFFYMGDREKEREYTFKAFHYDIPRSESCCRLGYYFLENKQYRQATFWYKLATELPEPDGWAIVNNASRTWLPHMKLGQCYFESGEYKKALEHLLKARGYLPDDEGIASNIRTIEELSVESGQPLTPER